MMDASETVTVKVPLALRKRGGRKLVVTPDNAETTAQPSRTPAPNALIRALAKAFRWRKMLESGDYATIAELAEAEVVNTSYLSRVLRLTLLSPQIVEAALNNPSEQAFDSRRISRPFPAEWRLQKL